MNLEGVLEGLLFIQGDEGITLEDSFNEIKTNL